MEKNYPGETWKKVDFKLDIQTNYALEVSNYGRLKSYSKNAQGNFIKGSMINGYRIIRLKFFKPRDPQIETELSYIREQINILTQKITATKQVAKGKPLPENSVEPFAEEELENVSELLKGLKDNYNKKIYKETKERTIHYHALIHRLVAESFIQPPSDKHTVVSHIDYDKLNNHRGNLKWMTVEENYTHQKSSPMVMAAKGFGVGKRKEDSKATKLTTTKVMLLKKLLNEGKPMRSLVKQFKVTETQILRIKRGENWTEVQAAK